VVISEETASCFQPFSKIRKRKVTTKANSLYFLFTYHILKGALNPNFLNLTKYRENLAQNLFQKSNFFFNSKLNGRKLGFNTPLTVNQECLQ